MQQHIKLLFIEDDDLLRSLFGEAFTIDNEFSYQLIAATDLKTGMEKVSSENPELIILDLVLPYNKLAAQSKDDYSATMGISLLKDIKANSVHKHIPIIIFSNLNDLKIKKQTLDAGAEEYLVKSETTPEQFLLTIKAVLKKYVKSE